MFSSPILGFVWFHVRSFRWRILGISLMRLVADGMWLMHPFLLGLMTTEAVKGAAASMDLLGMYSWMYVVNFLVRMLILRLEKYLLFSLQSEVSYRLEQESIERMMTFPLEWHDEHHSGTKVPTVTRAATSLTEYLSVYEGVFLELIVTTGGVFVVVWGLHPVFTLIFGIFAVLSLLTLIFIKKSIRRVHKDKQEMDNLLAADRFETVQNMHTVLVTGAFPAMNKRLKEKSTAALSYARRSHRITQSAWYIYNVLWILSFAAMFWMGVVMVRDGTLPVGMLMTLLFYFRNIDQMMTEVSDGLQRLMVASVAIEQYQSLISRTESRPRGHRPYPHDWKTFKVTGIVHRFGDKTVLRGVDLTIRRGEKVGIVGSSGSGKSTLLSLCADMRDPSEGQVRYDTVSLADIEDDLLRVHQGVALQDTEVFHYSLEENLRIAAPKATDSDLQRVYAYPWMASLLKKMPEGPQTLLGEKGVRLSGGERQRLGLARALMKQPDLLLLDEATSHLDSLTEAQVQETIKGLSGVTTMAVAHRLSTLRDFDRIVVLEKGRIVQDGTWDQLSREQGKPFARLLAKQMQEGVIPPSVLAPAASR